VIPYPLHGSRLQAVDLRNDALILIYASLPRNPVFLTHVLLHLCQLPVLLLRLAGIAPALGAARAALLTASSIYATMPSFD
jgi:hypothetical protein